MPDATQQGAPAANPAPAAIPDLNDPNTRLSHADGYAAMIARRRETIAKEMTAGDFSALVAARSGEAAPGVADPDVDPADAIAEQERARLNAGQMPAAPDGDPEPASNAAGVARARGEPVILSDEDLPNYLVRTKVLGEERMVPLNELRTTAQKTESADRYLEQSRGLLNEVKQAISQQQAGAPATPATTDVDPERQTSAPGDPLDAYVDALYEGDHERAKAHLRRALPGSPDELARTVEQRIVIRTALKQLAKNHKTIVSDPTLRRVADAHLMEVTGGKPLESLEPDEIPEALEEAATRTEAWLRRNAGIADPVAAAQPKMPSRDERRQRKESIDELPSAGARATAVVRPPATASDTIARMAAQRAGHVVLPT